MTFIEFLFAMGAANVVLMINEKLGLWGATNRRQREEIEDLKKQVKNLSSSLDELRERTEKNYTYLRQKN